MNSFSWRLEFVIVAKALSVCKEVWSKLMLVMGEIGTLVSYVLNIILMLI